MEDSAMKKLTAILVLALAANGAVAEESITALRDLAVRLAVADGAVTGQRGDNSFFTRKPAGERFAYRVDAANRKVFSRIDERLDRKLNAATPAVSVPLQQVNLVF
jgi:hypothetical protein